MSSTQSGPAGVGPTRPCPADRVERWPIERLIPYANNPRLHSEADLDKIVAAILKWGWTLPILVDEQGNVLAGALRLRAAIRLGLKDIPVIVARGWSEEEKRAYRLADNQLATRASWDFELLSNELRDLKFGGFDLGLTGFEPGQLKSIMAGTGSRSDRSGQRPGCPRSTGHSARRCMGVGRQSGWLRRQHQRGGCRTGAGRIAAPPDDHRSTLWRRLRPILASGPGPEHGQSRAGQGAQRRPRRLARGVCALPRGCRLCLARRSARRHRRRRLYLLRVPASRSDRLGQAALHLEPRRLSLETRNLLVRGA